MVLFVVRYEDGTTAELEIDEGTLARGEDVLPIICREKQEAGEIPAGPFVSIRRIVEPTRE
jgi:hypothetical protein